MQTALAFTCKESLPVTWFLLRHLGAGLGWVSSLSWCQLVLAANALFLGPESALFIEGDSF